VVIGSDCVYGVAVLTKDTEGSQNGSQNWPPSCRNYDIFRSVNSPAVYTSAWQSCRHRDSSGRRVVYSGAAALWESSGCFFSWDKRCLDYINYLFFFHRKTLKKSHGYPGVAYHRSRHQKQSPTRSETMTNDHGISQSNSSFRVQMLDPREPCARPSIQLGRQILITTNDRLSPQRL
jgi:hypothetical protein